MKVRTLGKQIFYSFSAVHQNLEQEYIWVWLYYEMYTVQINKHTFPKSNNSYAWFSMKQYWISSRAKLFMHSISGEICFENLWKMCLYISIMISLVFIYYIKSLTYCGIREGGGEGDYKQYIFLLISCIWSFKV